MVNQVTLNNDTHRNLRVITDRGAQYGENVHIVPVVAEELGSLVLEYPVCLMKNPQTGRFEMSALLGFEAGENLYLDSEGWNAIYIPVHIRRQPFLVGFSTDEDGQRIPDSAVLSVDLDNPRVQEDKGERMFNDDGSNTEFLDTVNNLLFNLIPSVDSTSAFLSVLSQHDLIESSQIAVTFANAEKKTYEGLYTINQEKMAGLTGDLLEDFNKKGYLQACSLLSASMGNIAKLLSRKNELLSAEE